MHDLASGEPGTPVDFHAARVFPDRLADALMRKDFDAYADLILLPLVVTTQKARFLRATRADLRIGFDLWQRTIEVYRVSHFIQPIQSVERFSDTGLIIVHDTELLCGSQRSLPTFTNWMFLRRAGEDWLLEQLLSGVSNTEHSLFIDVDPGNPTPIQ